MNHKQLPSETYYPPPPRGYYPPSPPAEKEINLLDYLKVLQKRKWLILAIFAIVLTVTVVGIFTVKPVFRGTATIRIDKENPQIVDFREIFRSAPGTQIITRPIIRFWQAGNWPNG